MKMRNKGKVYPSPSSSSSTTATATALSHPPPRDSSAVLKLLPTAILALASVLSLEDQEVLAYMITRSIASNPSPISGDKSKKKPAKKSDTHKPPVFDCGCFDCYRSYWFRWDSSPNRELIHQAIEAFEDHLPTAEKSKKREKGKKRDKMTRQSAEKTAGVSDTLSPEIETSSFVGSPENDASQVGSPEKTEETADKNGEVEVENIQEEEEASAAMVLRSSPASDHKGMARKVLPDVLGLLNSRLWSLWNPNV